MKCLTILITYFLVIHINAQPKISFTFDDGSISDRPGYSFEKWNTMLLNKLDAANIEATFFVSGKGIRGEKGDYLLKSWDEKKHKIANHTYSHPNFNDENVSLKDFSNEILINDTIISKYANHIKLFRFPYLKEGNTDEKINGIRDFLQKKKYNNGYVTIDTSDWYIDSRLVKRLRENPTADISAFRDFYLNHIWEKIKFHEALSYKLTGRHINHTLLLHHNLANALFIDDLIVLLKNKKCEIVSTVKAFNDPIFKKTPKYAGDGLIHALAKDSGKYNELLKDLPENNRYDKGTMRQLGL